MTMLLQHQILQNKL